MTISLILKNASQALRGIKYYHVLLWLVASFMLLFISYDPHTSILPQWAAYLVFTASAAPVCFYVPYKLVPTYLYKKRIGAFITRLLLLAFLNATISHLISLYVYHLVSGHPMFRSVLYFVVIQLAVYIVELILVIVSCIIKIIKDRYFMEHRMLVIEEEKARTELDFLRSQVNPHFLFNVMNTIYFQIDQANSEARLSVEKFSEMLRYQLYECTTDRISLKKELHYIENFVAIQSLRLEKDFDVRLDVDPNMQDFMIAPLLILPLVENAFKHVSSFREAGRHKIHIQVKARDARTLVIVASNTYEEAGRVKPLLQSEGLGLQNLKRRLELLYPQKHSMRIQKEDMYTTILELTHD